MSPADGSLVEGYRACSGHRVQPVFVRIAAAPPARRAIAKTVKRASSAGSNRAPSGWGWLCRPWPSTSGGPSPLRQTAMGVPPVGPSPAPGPVLSDRIGGTPMSDATRMMGLIAASEDT